MNSRNDFFTDDGQRGRYRAVLLALDALEDFNEADGGVTPPCGTTGEAVELARSFSQGAATCAFVADRILAHMPGEGGSEERNQAPAVDLAHAPGEGSPLQGYSETLPPPAHTPGERERRRGAVMDNGVRLRTIAALARDLSELLDEGNKTPSFYGEEISVPALLIDLIDASMSLSGAVNNVLTHLPVYAEASAEVRP